MNEWNNKYNPFNSMKALAHAEYWKPIVADGPIPWPRMVSLDPCGACNYNCPHCNAAKSFERGHKTEWSSRDIISITELLASHGTKAVCVGGGGEPLMHSYISQLLYRLNKAGIKIGVVTNGYRLPSVRDAIRDTCTWVGVSMDAGSPYVYSQMKGCKEDAWHFVCANIKDLCSVFSAVTFKFLIHPLNIADIRNACIRADNLGCEAIHIRPGAQTWFGAGGFDFTDGDWTDVENEVSGARNELRDSAMRVYCVTHKFKGWQPARTFGRCWAGYTTCVIQSNGMVGLCCDRRGDKAVDLCHYSELEHMWGSKKHHEIVEGINVSACPRCTYCHINEMFERVLLNNEMLCDFY